MYNCSPRRKVRENEAETIFKILMTDDVPQIMKDMKPQIQEALKKNKIKKFHSRDSIEKLLKTKDEENILKAA